MPKKKKKMKLRRREKRGKKEKRKSTSYTIKQIAMIRVRLDEIKSTNIDKNKSIDK